MPLSSLTKKLIIILISLAIIVVASYLVYYFFFRQDAPSDTSNNEISLEPKKTQKIFPLSKETILGATIDPNGKKVKYYAKSSGNILSVAFNGSEYSTLSSANLSGLIKAFWSPDKEKVISYFEEKEQIKKYLHNYSNGQSTLLNEKIEQAAWSPDSKKIAVLTYDENASANIVSIANADGSELKVIFQTRIKDISIEWPSADKISVKTKPSGLSEGTIISLNPDNGEFTTVISGEFGLVSKWSPLGDILVYSFTSPSGKNPSLSSSNRFGQNKISLEIASLADKCVFSQDNRSLFCAVPERISENAIWPDDYYKRMVATNDSFYKINLESSQKTLIYAADSEKSYDAGELLLSPEEDFLIFTNRRDGLLYSLRIE